MPQIDVTITRSAGTSLTAKVREHEVQIDRPATKGGGNLGPMGGELLLVALGGCFMSTLIAAAAARNVTLAGASCSVRGELTDAPSRFSEIELQVSCGSCEGDTLEHLVTIAERGCIVANTLKSPVALKVSTVK